MPREPVDLEELARMLLREKVGDEDILQKLSDVADSGHWARAILAEVRSTEVLEGVTSNDLRMVLQTPTTDLTAGETGLGCRGEGDFYIHEKIAEIAGGGGVLGVPDLDDSGVVDLDEATRTGKEKGKGGVRRRKGKLIAVAVDGVHSRLNHFPFLMGFHVARATLRDIVVSGAVPLAMFSDLHIGNDGDVGKIMDFTAGVTTVGEALGVPLISGSTLRIGGDMVLGGRLTGCVGSVGKVIHLTPRGNVKQGDVLVMTEGAGGGTIATTALFNGMGEYAAATLNLKTLRAGLALLDSKLIGRIHSMTDVSNGGIKGDAFHMAGSSGVRIVIEHGPFKDLVEPGVLSMLENLDIDPLGVSIDAILLSVSKRNVRALVEFFEDRGVRMARIGKVEKGKGVALKAEDGSLGDLRPRFREAPYTPIKRLVDQPCPDIVGHRSRIDKATKEAIKKKKMVLKMLKKS